MTLFRKHIKDILNAFSGICPPLHYHITCRHFPKTLSLSVNEAEHYLHNIWPDKGQTCIHNNDILAEYDLHIIIPVYNTSEYIKECLDSIFRQQTDFSYFVSIINDGSTDNSSEIISNYLSSQETQQFYERIEVIEQSNQGPSAARNAALNNIRGRYLMFVDSDDMLLPGCIDSLMNAAINYNADIAEGNFNCGPTYGCACGKVYRSELFRNVHFPPGYWFEDTINIFFLYPMSRKTVQVNGLHYYYRNNESSIMHSFQKKSRAIDSLWVSRSVLSDYFSQGHNATPQLFHNYLQDIRSTATHLHTLNDEKVMQAMFVIHCEVSAIYFRDFLKDQKCPKPLNTRLYYIASSLSENNYRKFRAATL